VFVHSFLGHTTTHLNGGVSLYEEVFVQEKFNPKTFGNN
jgi:hypothetical protein